jgi:hypothetical protein
MDDFEGPEDEDDRKVWWIERARKAEAEVERLRALNGRLMETLYGPNNDMDVFEYVTYLEAEVERLRALNGRLRKAVNWLRRGNV